MTNGGLAILHRYEVRLPETFGIACSVPFHVFTYNWYFKFSNINLARGTGNALVSPSAIDAIK